MIPTTPTDPTAPSAVTPAASAIPTDPAAPNAVTATATPTDPIASATVVPTASLRRKKDGSVRFPARFATGGKAAVKPLTRGGSAVLNKPSNTRQIVPNRKSAGANAPTKSIVSTKRKSSELSYPVRERNTRPKKLHPNDIGRSLTSYCCICGRGGRILENCSGDNGNCPNSICVGIDDKFNEKDRKDVCEWNLPYWVCRHHKESGSNVLQLYKFDGTIVFDIQSLELGDFFDENIIEPAVKSFLGSYMIGQVRFHRYKFNDANSLSTSGATVATKWRAESRKWLLLTSHVNDQGDIWFEIKRNGEGSAAKFGEFLKFLLEDGANRNINIVFLVCGPILVPKEKKNREILTMRFTQVLTALKTWTTGKVIMFTANDLQPRNVISDLLKVIECHEIEATSLSQVVARYFQGGQITTPIWVFVAGDGTFIHPQLAPCKQHTTGQKIGEWCVYIKNFVATVVRCKLPRMDSANRNL